MDYIFDAINLALFVAVSIILINRYRASRRAGYLWLALPLVVLPFLSLPAAHLIKASVNRLMAGEPGVLFPFSLVESGRMTLGGLLAAWNGAIHILWSASVLVALFMLGERRPRVQH